MRFKLVLAVVEGADTDAVVAEARRAGATGATVLSLARGEGRTQGSTFLAFDVGDTRDVVLFLVEEHLARHVLESIAAEGDFDTRPGAGIAFQVDVEDAVGVAAQVSMLQAQVEGEL